LQGDTPQLESYAAPEPELPSPARIRAAEQVNILALVGGFSILLAAYFFVFVFTS